MADKKNQGGCGVVENECGFPEELSRIISQLSLALQDMCEQIPGGARKSYNVHNALGIDVKLSWQVYKLAGNSDPFALAPHVPVATSMRRLLEAAANYGIDSQRIDKVQKAYKEFEGLVVRHAKSRAQFDSMANSLAQHDEEEAQQIDVRYRKTMFQGNSHFCGVQSDAYVGTLMVHPGDEPDRYHLAQLRVKIGMRSLRPNVRPIIDMSKYGYKQSKENFILPQPFDEAAYEKHSAFIIPEFCTQPFPKLETNITRDGRSWTRLASDAIGLQGSVDLVTGSVWRNSRLFPLQPDEAPGFGMTISVPYPVTVVIGDLLVHRNSLPRLHEQIEMYGHSSLCDEVMEIREYESPLLLRERLNRISMPLKNLSIREVPGYLDMLKYSAGKLNYRLEDFDAYRFRIEYPLIDTKILIWMRLQEKAAAIPVRETSLASPAAK